MPVDIATQFNKNELFLLKKIGIEFHGDEISVFKQGKRPKHIKTLPLANIKKIALSKTGRQDFNWWSIHTVLNQDIFQEANEHASQIYALQFHFKNGRMAQTDIVDFDLITVSRLIDQINEALKNI